MRVAIIHYWLVGMRGGERVLEQLCLMFPQADIYTHVADPSKLSPLLRRHKITETFIGRLPGAKKHYQKYLALMPRALESLDLSGYDLVISSESGAGQGRDPAARHAACLLLPFAHALYLGPVSRLSRRAVGADEARLRLAGAKAADLGT